MFIQYNLSCVSFKNLKYSKYYSYAKNRETCISEQTLPGKRRGGRGRVSHFRVPPSVAKD